MLKPAFLGLLAIALPLHAAQSQLAARSAPPASEFQSVELYLDGSVRAAAESKKESSVATGALGMAFASNIWLLTAQLNVIAKGDTIRKRPGSTLLVPGSGGFTSGFVEVHRKLPNWKDWMKGKPWANRLRTRGYVSITSTVWELPEDTIPGPTPTVRKAVALGAIPVGYGAGLSYVLSGSIKDVDDARVGLKFDLGFVQRNLYGDVMDSPYEARRERFLGTAKRKFYGYEAGMRLSYRDIVGSLVYYNFPKMFGVPGFTRGQIAAGFAISAPVLKGQFNENK